MAIQKVRMEQVTDDLGNTTILHPETSADNVLYGDTTIDKALDNKIGLNSVFGKSIFNLTSSDNKSIDGIEVNDGVNPSKKLLLSTDSNHVEMATGRTLEEEYTSLLKQHGKEFVGDSSGKITVNNGIKGRVISGEIKGQTVKNLANQPNSVGLYQGELVSNCITNSQPLPQTITCYNFLNKPIDLVFNNAQGGWGTQRKIPANSYIKMENILNWKLRDVWGRTADGWNGLSDLDYFNSKKIVIIEGDYDKNIINSIPFGLSSTQAIINNNSQSYPIYEPLITGKTRILDADTGLVPTDPTLPALKDGDVLDLATRTITFANKTTQVLTDEQVKAYSKFKKVILCHKVGDVADTFEVKENGSGVFTQNTFYEIINSNSLISLDTAGTQVDGYTRFSVMSKYGLSSGTNAIVRIKCDNMNVYTWDSMYTGKTMNGIARPKDSTIRLSMPNTIANSVDGLKSYLAINPIPVVYEIDVITTIIDKSLMPTILTADKINICSIASPVAPSSFKLTLPVDINGEQNAAISALQTAVALLQQQVLTLQAFHK